MKIKSISEHGYNHLTLEDIEDLEDMIGVEVCFSDSLGNDYVNLPDGTTCHVDFLDFH